MIVIYPMKKQLPKCINAKDKRTGANHNLCARNSSDMGKIVIVDDYREGHQIMSGIKEVLDYSKENFRTKDVRRIVNMASKSFRLARKLEKEGSGEIGIGTPKFRLNLGGKGKKSTSV